MRVAIPLNTFGVRQFALERAILVPLGRAPSIAVLHASPATFRSAPVLAL